jgi:hypothetical protein
MTKPELWEDPDMLAHDPDRDLPPPEETEEENHPLRLGLIGEIILAFGAVAIAWFAVSTVLFLGYIVLGIGICSFSPDAAICMDTIGGAFQFFYFDSWKTMLNPSTWVGGFYEP